MQRKSAKIYLWQAASIWFFRVKITITAYRVLEEGCCKVFRISMLFQCMQAKPLTLILPSTRYQTILKLKIFSEKAPPPHKNKTALAVIERPLFKIYQCVVVYVCQLMEAGGWGGCRGEKNCPRVRVHTRRLPIFKTWWDSNWDWYTFAIK